VETPQQGLGNTTPLASDQKRARLLKSRQGPLRPGSSYKKGHDSTEATKRSDHRYGRPKICPVVGEQKDAN
jgi:hypothetical protein